MQKKCDLYSIIVNLSRQRRCVGEQKLPYV